jgi:hypothetical protein
LRKLASEGHPRSSDEASGVGVDIGFAGFFERFVDGLLAIAGRAGGTDGDQGTEV